MPAPQSGILRGAALPTLFKTTPAPIPAPDKPRPQPKFPRDELGFHTELKRRVAEYFTRTGKSERDCWQMYLKTAIILAWIGVSYGFLVFWAEHWWQGLPLAASLGFALAGAAFCIQHDGGHHAYSNRNWVNRLAALALDMIGASSYLWRWKHTVFHHTYSNIPDHDPDIELGSLMRFHAGQPLRRHHRWQQVYLFMLYGLMAARWHLLGDFQDYINKKTGPNPIPRPHGMELFGFVLGKVFSFSYFLVIPMMFHDWYVVLGYYLFTTCVIGFLLSIVFQLAHCVGEADFPPATGDPLRAESSWAIHQIQTSIDFARSSRVLCWYLGGLNFQCIHHLFPRVCHVHYPAMAKIVEDTCREYGVRYYAFPTFWAGVVSHYRYLKKMGRPEPTTAA